MGLTLLVHCHAPLSFWLFAFQTSVFLINRFPTYVLSNSTPYELLYKKNHLSMIFSRPLVVLSILCYVLIISINWNIVQLNVSSQDIVLITKGFYVFINSPVESMLLGMLFLMNLTSSFVIFLLHHLFHLILCPLLRFVPLFLLLYSFIFLPLHYLLHQLPLHHHLHLSLHFNLNSLLHQHLILFHSLLEPLLCPLPFVCCPHFTRYS